MELQSVGRLSLETPHVASAPTTASRSPEPTTRAPGGASHDSRPAVDVTALTTRDDFLLELGQALGRQAAVRPVESLEETLRSMAGPKRPQGPALRTRGAPALRPPVDAPHPPRPRPAPLRFAAAPAVAVPAPPPQVSVFSARP